MNLAIRLRSLVCLILTTLILISCQNLYDVAVDVHDELFGIIKSSATEIDHPKELHEAKSFLTQGKDRRALEEVQTYLRVRQDIYWYGYAYLLMGEAQEKLGLIDDSIKSYKEAIKYGAGYDSPILATAIYRLSWVYESQEYYQKLVTLLLDLDKNLTNKDRFIKQIELPARLANTYYALGQWENALKYRRRSLAFVKNFNTDEVQAIGAARFYKAKRYQSLTALRLEAGVSAHLWEKIPLVHKDLLDIGEMAPEGLSSQAYTSLRQGYKLMVKQIARKQKQKTAVQRVVANRKRLSQAIETVDHLAELRAERRAQEFVKNYKQTQSFFKFVGKNEEKLKTIAYGLNVGIQDSQKKLNPEEKEAVKRKVRDLKLPTRVNKEFLRRHRSDL